MTSLSSPPVIRSFRIYGLHGYKDVEIKFDGPVRIVIAENGTGKTTILSAMDAFLQGNLPRLANISFESIECLTSTSDRPLTLRRKDITDFGSVPLQDEVELLAQFADAEALDLQRQILESKIDSPADLRSNPLFNEIYANSPYDWADLLSRFIDIRSRVQASHSDSTKALLAEVSKLTDRYAVVYLPTYRRVEIAQHKSTRTRGWRPGRAPRLSSQSPASRAKWEGGDIKFALADVSDRLETLIKEIQRQSNIGYRAISGSIIDDLLLNRVSADYEPASLPDIDTLERFFVRLEASGDTDRIGTLRGLYASDRIKDNKMLSYFLKKLSTVIDSTKELEANIENFVSKSNEYLQQSSDKKLLQYDPSHPNVSVRNIWTDQEVKLDDLSSGEKQVISLFAILYLYPQQKLVLIDEPELSLSIEWQQRLLPDVLAAPSCAQLLAITHSPFVFDNSLDSYAGPLSIKRARETPQ